jgi:hypothetical protein
MNKRRLKKAYQKAMRFEPLKGREEHAVYNGHGDFTKRLVDQIGLGTRGFWFVPKEEIRHPKKEIV